ncbi:alpha carbonic anhydrase [Aspergillus pseudonomiae]|uniref:Carbonic anhydrase n=1 Tax=Aspergillus pseudonomiae TaxID=1506151 RepID=A0A5N7DEZ3_9EURO|nr:alpha carbonic anhydrase [Aspergillus pseudonomiae]KAB8259277.1 alpha carbonic anhydrase [Aspergillus pseudonomiae]KAE8405026.1 alpha carbonic anhydrase [Aspergillus pseudonomiae]
MKFITAFLPLLSVASASCIPNRVVRRAADGLVDINKFNYTNLGGPLNWAGLDEANEACSKGSHQSPIVIDTDAIDYAASGSLKLNLPSADNAKFENLGSGLEVVLTNGSLEANNKTYPLAQFHFHTPSEHRVNDEYFPMEVHFVFQTAAKETAVVGFFFQLSEFGYSVPLFDSVFAHIDDIADAGTYTTTGELDFEGLRSHFTRHGVYQYTGSLTTPPCTEEVVWYLSTEPLPLNVQTYNKVKKILKYNARYTQNALGEENLLEVAAHNLN